MVKQIGVIFAALLFFCPLSAHISFAQDINHVTIGLVKYIQIDKDKDGKLVNIVTNQTEIPQKVVESLPKTKDERILNREQIKELATKYQLFERTKINPQLRYKEGDISYWVEQKISAWELSLELLSRRLVLLAADQQSATIPTQGDLSNWSQKIYASLYNSAQTRWSK